MATPAIEVHNLVKQFECHFTILKGISFTIDSGEFAALVGRSGCGKTTLLNILGGLDRPTSGDVKIDGDSITGLSQDQLARMRLEKIGFVFQDLNLLTDETVRQNISLPLRFSHKSAPKDVDFMMAELGIEHIADKMPNRISGGEAQRAAIARAMMNKPKIILADEPTGSLDNENASAVVQAFQRVRDDFGTTVLLATHNENVAKNATVRIHLDNGSISSNHFG